MKDFSKKKLLKTGVMNSNIFKLDVYKVDKLNYNNYINYYSLMKGNLIIV